MKAYPFLALLVIVCSACQTFRPPGLSLNTEEKKLIGNWSVYRYVYRNHLHDWPDYRSPPDTILYTDTKKTLQFSSISGKHLNMMLGADSTSGVVSGFQENPLVYSAEWNYDDFLSELIIY